MRAHALLLLVTPFAAACSEGQGSSGALDQVHFSSDCGPADVGCLGEGLGSAPIALGTRVKVNPTLTFKGSAALALTLSSANPEILASSAGELSGVSEGIVALLATTQDGRLVDFIHVSVQAPTRLGMHRLTEEGLDLGEVDPRFQMLVGQKTVLDVKPYHGALAMLGDVKPEWSSSSPSLSILDDGLGSRRSIVARSTGTAQVTVSAASMTVDVGIEVLP